MTVLRQNLAAVLDSFSVNFVGNQTNQTLISMGFASKGVWVMGYCGCMGYGALFPANQLGGLKKVWNLREYGVCEPWVTRESTVINNSSTVPSIPFKHRTHLIFYGGVKTMSKAGSTKVEQMLCLAKALHAVSVLHILFIKGQPLISLYYFEGIL